MAVTVGGGAPSAPQTADFRSTFGVMALSMAALSVRANATNATASGTDVAAGTDGHALRRSGTSLGFGTLATGAYGDATVTLAKMANLAQDQAIGRVTASTGVPETFTVTAAARTVLDDTTVAAMVNTLGGATSSGTGGLARTNGATHVAPIITGVTTYSGASDFVETSLGDFVAHIADGAQLTSTMTANASLTFDSTPSDTRVFGPVRVPANSGGPYTLTIPSSVNVATGATITTVSVPASGQVELTFRRIGSVNYVYGVPASAGASTALADITDMSANARTFNAAADYSAMRTALGVAIGSNVQAYSSVLATLAGASANGQSLVTAANYAAMRTALTLVVGTNVQAYSANLDEYAAVNPTTAGLALLDDADAAAQRTTLSAAARAQTGMMPIFIRTVADETLRLIINTPVGLTITNITTRCASGTCTVTGQIDGTPLGGTANSASSTEQSQAHASANVMAAGTDFLLAFSSNSACLGLAVNVHYTYTQA